MRTVWLEITVILVPAVILIASRQYIPGLGKLRRNILSQMQKLQAILPVRSINSNQHLADIAVRLT